jgi:hypothetical protein
MRGFNTAAQRMKAKMATRAARLTLAYSDEKCAVLGFPFRA